MSVYPARFYPLGAMAGVCGDGRSVCHWRLDHLTDRGSTIYEGDYCRLNPNHFDNVTLSSHPPQKIFTCKQDSKLWCNELYFIIKVVFHQCVLLLLLLLLIPHLLRWIFPQFSSAPSHISFLSQQQHMTRALICASEPLLKRPQQALLCRRLTPSICVIILIMIFVGDRYFCLTSPNVENCVKIL